MKGKIPKNPDRHVLEKWQLTLHYARERHGEFRKVPKVVVRSDKILKKKKKTERGNAIQNCASDQWVFGKPRGASLGGTLTTEEGRAGRSAGESR